MWTGILIGALGSLVIASVAVSRALPPAQAGRHRRAAGRSVWVGARRFSMSSASRC